MPRAHAKSSRSHVHPRIVAGLIVCIAGAVLLAGNGTGRAASSGSVVGATVLSATSISNTLCLEGQAGRTSLGSVTPGSGLVGSLDCEVTFGSSNDTAMLRIGQADGYDTAMARAGWQTRPPGVTTPWDAVDAGSSTRAWIVGSGGAIRTTVDAGATWSGQTSNTVNGLRALDVVGASTAWTVGDSGTVRRTIDAGATAWTDVDNTLGTAANIRTVTALDATTAWVGGDAGIVRRTTDGGGTWTAQNTCAGNTVNDLHAPSALVVWATCFSGGIFRSIDGGATWAPVTNPEVGQSYRTVWSTSASVAWIGSTNGQLYRTADGGATWSSRLTVAGNNIDDIFGVDALNLWAVADIDGHAYRSVDGGLTWTKDFEAGAPVKFVSITALDSGRALVAAWETVGSTGRIYGTPTDPVADYDDAGGDDWSTAGANMFGACLRSVSAGAATVGGTTWIADSDTIGDEAAISADCGDGDADPWNAIPAVATNVARLGTPQSPATATAHLRFGFKAGASQAAGTYRAPVTFTVVAPA